MEGWLLDEVTNFRLTDLLVVKLLPLCPCWWRKIRTVIELRQDRERLTIIVLLLPLPEAGVGVLWHTMQLWPRWPAS